MFVRVAEGKADPEWWLPRGTTQAGTGPLAGHACRGEPPEPPTGAVHRRL